MSDETKQRLEDFRTRVFLHRNFLCAAIHNYLGFWCGYVGIAKDHPLHGTEVESIFSENLNSFFKNDVASLLYNLFYGGVKHPYISFSGFMEPKKTFNKNNPNIIFIDKKNWKASSRWFFGFDCGRSKDLIAFPKATKTIGSITTQKIAFRYPQYSNLENCFELNGSADKKNFNRTYKTVEYVMEAITSIAEDLYTFECFDDNRKNEISKGLKNCANSYKISEETL